MGWLARSALRPEAPPAAEQPAAEANAEAHPSPGLAGLIAGVAGAPSHRVLDLGPALGINLDVYSRFARSVRFADLSQGWRTEGLAGANPSVQLPEALDRLVGVGEEPVDLVFLWDLLNYLDRAGCGALLGAIARVSREGTRMFAVVWAGRTMPAAPLRVEIVDEGTLRYRTASVEMVPCPSLAPAEVERRILPFRVERAVLLRHGLREVVAVLPRGATEPGNPA